MKKFFESFYIFSKLSLSFVLLISLFGVLYILYVNYEKEKLNDKSKLNIEDELKNNIDNNAMLISEINKKIIQNQTALEDIKNSIKLISTKDQELDLSKINDNIVLLTQNLEKLNEDVKIIKNNNKIKLSTGSDDKNNIIKDGRDEIIDLILIKYENNLSLNKEIEYLINLSDENNINQIEKISILAQQPFKGFNYLRKIYDEEVSIYLKTTINNHEDSLLNKIIFPYLEVSPTTENTVNNDIILKIKEIKSDISNRNIKHAIKKIKNINDYDNVFNLTFLEMNKFNNFKNELYKLK